MRRANDFYPTEEALTRDLLRYVPICGEVGEVCAGQMDMANVLRNDGCISSVITNDIVPHSGLDFVSDATQLDSAVWQREYDYVVTNPPFSVAFDILRNAWVRTRIGVALLLRLSFLEPVGGRYDDDGKFYWLDDARGQWLKDHERDLSHMIIFGSSRPSFTGNGRHDNVTTAWMVWQHGRRHHGQGTKIIFRPGWKVLGKE
jgi:hypothetical protein